MALHIGIGTYMFCFLIHGVEIDDGVHKSSILTVALPSAKHYQKKISVVLFTKGNEMSFRGIT